MNILSLVQVSCICCVFLISASIRRTSMREKTMLSLKEAREEAAHFGFVSQPDEDENNQDTAINVSNHNNIAFRH